MAIYFVLKTNGLVLDASLQPKLSVSTLSANIDFLNPRGDPYTVLDTAQNGIFTGSRRYAEQFYLDLKGLVPTYVTSQMGTVLKSSWESKSRLKNYHLSLN